MFQKVMLLVVCLVLLAVSALAAGKEVTLVGKFNSGTGSSSIITEDNEYPFGTDSPIAEKIFMACTPNTDDVCSVTVILDKDGGINKVIKAEQITQSKASKKLSFEQWVMIFVVFVTIVLLMYGIGIKFHGDGRMNIFIDYTDALLTVLAVFIPLILLIFASDSDDYLFKLFCFFVFIVMIFLPVKSAFIYNSSFKMALLSITIKFFTSFMYVLGLYFILTSGSGKKDGESQLAYEVRLQRQNASRVFWLMIHHAIMGWIVCKTSRIQTFTSETINMSFENKYDVFMQNFNSKIVDTDEIDQIEYT